MINSTGIFYTITHSGLRLAAPGAGIQLLCASLLVLCSAQAWSMKPLSDDQMADVSGAGIAIALEDFRFEMAPTSYLEQIGTPAGGLFERADLRWFGLTMSDAGAAAAGQTFWNGGGCAGGHALGNGGGLGCPQAGPVQYFAAHDNPYIVRAFDYTDLDVDGTSVSKTVLDVLAPTSQDDYKWSFWGEVEVDQGGPEQELLKTQTMIEGSAQNSKLRLFQFQEEGGNETLGLFYHSHLQGNFRFSAAQLTNNDTQGVPVDFEPEEGLHFVNVDAFLPLGALHYQALTLDSTAVQDGNFVLELARLPNVAAVYNEHYALQGGDTLGYATALSALNGSLSSTSNYFETHGYSRWGDWAPDGCIANAGSCTNNANNATNDGIFFSAPNGQSFTTYARTIDNSTGIDMEGDQGYNTPGGNPAYTTPQQITTQVVNIGDARIEGMNIHHLRLESLGVN